MIKWHKGNHGRYYGSIGPILLQVDEWKNPAGKKNYFFATCHPFFLQEPLGATSMDEAKCQATAKLQVALQDTIDEITSANERLGEKHD